jgi:hypothetical protein
MSKKRPRKGISRNSYVYIFDLGYEQNYKIGRSRDWRKRLKALQAGNPRIKCVMAYPVKSSWTIERDLHRMYSMQNIDREIFILTKEHLQKIRFYLESKKVFLHDKPPTTISKDQLDSFV